MSRTWSTNTRHRGLPLLLVALMGAPACGPDHPRLVKTGVASLLTPGRGQVSPDVARETLVRRLPVAPLPNGVFPARATLEAIYARNGHRLEWSDDRGRILPRTSTLLHVLQRASEHGLDPADYALAGLDRLKDDFGQGRLGDGAISALADFDILATAAFLRYASDVSTGRVHPDQVRSDWHTNPPELDFVALLEQALSTDQVKESLESLPPPHPGYARLREMLAKLREVETTGGWPTVPSGPKLGLGARGPRVGLLRQRLAERSARTDSTAETAALDERFDAGLAESTRRFQERHGIEADGVVAARTLSELNVPVARRIRQVELNLERWRWIPRHLGDPHVLVNIPGFDLELVRSGAPTWRTRVVAGKSFTPTPVFSDRIVAIVANPPWNVPESIAVSEYLPELQKDEDALARHDLHLLEGSGEKTREVDPRSVDWMKVTAESFAYRLRQEPGGKNPLGRVKLQMTNDFHIYLHDTSAGHLFGRTERDLSHGCIRVENVVELANEIAGEPTRDKLREALEQPEERHLALDSKVPIHILYWTAWVDEVGALRFGPDVYELDPPQQAALDRVAPPLGTAAANVSLGPGGAAR